MRLEWLWAAAEELYPDEQWAQDLDELRASVEIVQQPTVEFTGTFPEWWTVRVKSDRNRYLPWYQFEIQNQFGAIVWTWKLDTWLFDTSNPVILNAVQLDRTLPKFDIRIYQSWHAYTIELNEAQQQTTPQQPTQPQIPRRTNPLDQLKLDELTIQHRINSFDGRTRTIRNPNAPDQAWNDQPAMRQAKELLIWYTDADWNHITHRFTNVDFATVTRTHRPTSVESIDWENYWLFYTASSLWIITLTLQTVNEQWVATWGDQTREQREIPVWWWIDWYNLALKSPRRAKPLPWMQKDPTNYVKNSIFGHYIKPSYVWSTTLSQTWEEFFDTISLSRALRDNAIYYIKGRIPWKPVQENLAEFTLDDLVPLKKINNIQTFTWKIYSPNKTLEWDVTVTFPIVQWYHVVNVAINSYPPSLWLSEDDEKIKQKHITRFDWAYNLTFQWLPTLWTWAHQEELRWFENKHTTTPVAYVGTDYISEEQKTHIESLFLTQKDANTPHILTLKWNNKFFGWTLIPSKICEIDLHDTSKWSYVDWHWCYTTLDANDEELVIQAHTRPENLTKTHQWPVLSIAILKVGPSFGEAFSTKDLPFLPDDFSALSDALKDAYNKIKDSETLRQWLEEVNKYYETIKDALSDVVVERITGRNIKKLSWEREAKFWQEVATHYDTKIYPLWSTVTAQDLRFLDCNDRSGDKDMIVRFNKPFVAWTNKIADIPYQENASNPQSYTVDVTDLKINTKNFWDNKTYTFSGTMTWKYQYEVTTMVGSDWKEKKVVRISVEPPQAYIDFMRDEFEPKLERWLDQLQNKLTFPATSKRITAPYNEIRSWRRHKWIDIGKDWGDLHALAAYDWVVTHVQTQTDAQWNITWYGTYVIVQHEYQWKKFRTVYAHLNKDWLVSLWDTVSAWKKIWRAEHRSDKRWTATWQHVHFELRVQDAWHKESGTTHVHDGRRDIDPIPYLNQSGTRSSNSWWNTNNWWNTNTLPTNPRGHPVFKGDFKTESITNWAHTIEFSMEPEILFYDNNIAKDYTLTYTNKSWRFVRVTFDEISWYSNPNNLHPKWSDGMPSDLYIWKIPDVKHGSILTITWPSNISNPVRISYDVR
jgi:murein DD-endopeptidase MepM/ murein hydrolase activator NlpD